jgi:Family of unknown function (DUF5681)
MTTKHLKKWAPGESGNPAGRPAGAKNRLQSDFLNALAEDFREHGGEAIRIMRVERPAEYVKCIASLLPNELLHSDSDGAPVQFARVEHVIVQVEHQPRLIEHEASDTQTQAKLET